MFYDTLPSIVELCSFDFRFWVHGVDEIWNSYTRISSVTYGLLIMNGTSRLPYALVWSLEIAS